MTSDVASSWPCLGICLCVRPPGYWTLSQRAMQDWHTPVIAVTSRLEPTMSLRCTFRALTGMQPCPTRVSCATGSVMGLALHTSWHCTHRLPLFAFCSLLNETIRSDMLSVDWAWGCKRSEAQSISFRPGTGLHLWCHGSIPCRPAWSFAHTASSWLLGSDCSTSTKGPFLFLSERDHEKERHEPVANGLVFADAFESTDLLLVAGSGASKAAQPPKAANPTKRRSRSPCPQVQTKGKGKNGGQALETPQAPKTDFVGDSVCPAGATVARQERLVPRVSICVLSRGASNPIRFKSIDEATPVSPEVGLLKFLL